MAASKRECEVCRRWEREADDIGNNQEALHGSRLLSLLAR